ncbi:hypothetical protein L479_03017 [Exiguobacterium sp. S17]|nr:hypothetical protein L479_03017 [Exiguobacterium sp. S17]
MSFSKPNVTNLVNPYFKNSLLLLNPSKKTFIVKGERYSAKFTA